MTRQSLSAAIALLVLAAGCSPVSQSSVTAPSAVAGTGGVTAASFGGSWASSSGTTGAAVPSGCAQFDYTVTPAADGPSARLAVNATCAGITVTASGQGTVVGETLSWSATGTASRGSVTCPFSFDNSTATLEGNGVRVTYAGSVCGIPVRGSEFLVRRG